MGPAVGRDAPRSNRLDFERRRARPSPRHYQTERCQCEAELGEQIADDCVQRPHRAPRYVDDLRAALEQRRAIRDESRRIDQRADTRIRDAHHRHFRFDRAHRRHREHLVRRRAFAVPRVVGDVHEDVGAFIDLAPRQIGKDTFVTDQNSELRPFEVEQRLLFAGNQIAEAVDDLVDEEAEYRTRGNVLAERHQLDFVVMRIDFALAVGRHEVRAIVKSQAAIGLRERRCAEQDRFVLVLGERQQRSAILRVTRERGGILIVRLEQERRRRLGPYDQVGAALRRVRGFVLVDAIALRQEIRIPLERLRNIALHHRDLEAARGRRLPDVFYSPRAERHECEHHRRQHAEADGLQAINAAAENYDVDDGVEEHDQRRDAVDAGKFRELDQFQIAICRVAEQVPWKRGGNISAKPFERRPRDRHRDHVRDSHAPGDELAGPDCNRRVDCDDRRQREHRKDRELHAHVGEVMQRNRNPVERYDVSREALQVCPPEDAPHALAFDHVEQRHQSDPRQQSVVELRECQSHREAAGYGERRARCVGGRHRQAGANISAIGITPAHGGWPLKRSKISSTSFQVSTSAAASGGSNLRSPATRHSRSKLQSIGGALSISSDTTRQLSSGARIFSASRHGR